jgi:predicted RNA-binding Zn-ribbon protein involved in translation (DUF1610 family)
MILECPGAKFFKQPEPQAVSCPFCSLELEIWTDEIKTICPECNNMITRQQAQSCLDWCKFAKDCIGEGLYKKYLQNKTLIS